MWIYIWVIISLFILGVFSWSLLILQRQKKAWSAFAKKYNLSYFPGRIVQAPSVKGAVFGHQIAYFPDQQATQDQRGQRFVTVLEFDVGQGMTTGGLIASPNFATMAANLTFADEILIDYPEWDKNTIVRTRAAQDLRDYLTKDRLEVIHSILSMKNSTALYFFDEQNAIVHIETSDPIYDVERLEKITQKITSLLPRLRLTEDEIKMMKK
ncbi:MAG: hypothetical protein ACK4NR_10425 [Micavibrio sp.]